MKEVEGIRQRMYMHDAWTDNNVGIAWGRGVGLGEEVGKVGGNVDIYNSVNYKNNVKKEYWGNFFLLFN